MVSDTQIKEIRQQLNALRENKTLDGEGADRSENLHRLFMYPAMMVPATQYAVIQGQGGQVSVSRWHEDASRTA